MNMNRRAFLVSPAFSWGAAAQVAGGTLRAGAATVNITPNLGSSMAGGMTDRIATDVHDELLVRCLALDNGRSRIAIATVDSCAVPRTVIDRSKDIVAASLQLPPSHLLISATHTHSAPPSGHLFQSVPDPKYTDWLTVRIADAVRIAMERLEPARIGWGVGREPRLVFNRRFFMKPGTIPPDPFGASTDRVQMNPPVASPNIVKAAGPTDPDVGVLAVEAADGRPIAVVGNYALHYVGGGGGGHLTADYFGAWAVAMARLSGLAASTRFPPFVPILTNACSGNINGVDFLKKRAPYPPYAQMTLYADILAAECYRTWRTIEFQNSVELGGSIEELEFGVRLPTAEEAAAARERLGQTGAAPVQKDRSPIYARETVLLHEQYPKTAKTPIQALRIGDLGIATLPGEAFVELGIEVKAKSPFRATFPVELANDYRGYIPTVEGHEVGGYETWRAKSSYLEKQAAPKMTAAALRRLGVLFRGQ